MIDFASVQWAKVPMARPVPFVVEGYVVRSADGEKEVRFSDSPAWDSYRAESELDRFRRSLALGNRMNETEK